MKEYKIRYESTGFVFGNYWEGGQGAYTARRLEAATKEELLKQAKEGLDGSLMMEWDMSLSLVLYLILRNLLLPI